ncbi:hypothetical protein SDC9_168065 [bioreactor metagenome]|uniref:Uncharacterized protein n=1 Tax=bioreactor metagenome TaxID=1076179 RepID=A0A645G3I3_9ZZZZ
MFGQTLLSVEHPACHKPAGIGEGNEEELVVVVRVWLELNQFRNQPYQDRAADNAAIFFFCRNKRYGRKQGDEPEVFDIEPEIVIRFICPVKVQL